MKDLHCESLTIVDKKGNPCLKLLSNEEGGVIRVIGRDRKIKATVSVYADNGCLAIMDENQRPMVVLAIDPDGKGNAYFGEDEIKSILGNQFTPNI
jgi:hypothetical protein